VKYFIYTAHRIGVEKERVRGWHHDQMRNEPMRAVGTDGCTIDLIYMVAPIFLFINTSNLQNNQNINHIFQSIKSPNNNN